MGDTVACWHEAQERVEEFNLASVAPPSRIRRIKQLVIDRKVVCLGPLHFAGYAVDPAHIDVFVFNNAEVMDGLRQTLGVMSIKPPWGVAGTDLAMNDYRFYNTRPDKVSSACPTLVPRSA